MFNTTLSLICRSTSFCPVHQHLQSHNETAYSIYPPKFVTITLYKVSVYVIIGRFTDFVIRN